MTKEEKQKRAEEKSRRKAEIAEQQAQRRAQLEALRPYWLLLRYDVNSRACPRDFFLFWARYFLAAAPWVVKGVFCLLDYVRHLFFTTIIVIILCIIFPPVLFFVEFSVLAFMIGLIWAITGALLFVVTVLPIFLSAVKRRINDVSRTASDAYLRFVLFVGTLGLMFLAICMCGLSWIGFPMFKTGCLSWSVGLGYTLLLAGIILFVGQMNYYSFAAGIKGENFAGANPVEIPLADTSLVDQGNHLGSKLWHIFSFVLIGLATVVSFALSHVFIQVIDQLSMLDLVLRSMRNGLPVLIYGMQGVVVVAVIGFACLNSRFKKGALSTSELANVNACFKAKFTEVTDDLRKQVPQTDDKAVEKRMGGFGSILGKASLVLKVLVSLYYYLLLFSFVGGMFKESVAIPLLLLILVGCAVVGYNYFKARMQEDSETVNWGDILSVSKGQMFSYVRTVVLLPFLKRGEKPSTGLTFVTQKRHRIRNVSLIDPLGIHNFVLGNREMGCIQLICCLFIVGIPFSWLWSLFDSIRFTKMSDDEFLLEYSDYCLKKSWVDRLLGLLGWLAIILAPFMACLVLLALAATFGSDGHDENGTGERSGTSTRNDTAEWTGVSPQAKEKSSDMYKITPHRPDDVALDSDLKELKRAFNDVGRELDKVNARDIEKACEAFGRELDKVNVRDIEKACEDVGREFEKSSQGLKNDLDAAYRELNSL